MTMAVGAIVPTFRRTGRLLQTLELILDSRVPPAEVLVHVDAGDAESGPAIRDRFPSVRVIESDNRVGPSGGRNRLLREATSPFIASFDDDSYPIDPDFFSLVEQLFEQHPSAGMIAAGAIVHDGESVPDRRDNADWVADFVGCGCAYRRAAFMETDGYIDLPLSYGVEEADLTLQMHSRGWSILRSGLLRVRHATALEHHRAPEITAASVSNLARLAVLRYPSSLWPYATLQIANRVAWLLRNGRSAGVTEGLCGIPKALLHHRHARSPVPAATVRRVRALRRAPEPA
jgi:GT2 family glycosyltransferase